MKKDTSNTLKRAQRFPVILIGEGLLVGTVSGLVGDALPDRPHICRGMAE